MLYIILIALLAAVVVVLLIAALKPARFRVTRSLRMGAPTAAVFPRVNELRNWEGWNPWGKLDPNMKLSYDGPPSGVGASYSWIGNNQVGEGKATIMECKPNEHVRFKIEFLKPMAGVSDTLFTFAPSGNQTEVTWDMQGQNNFIARVFCVFMNMDKMIGRQFEKGLADLKSIVEASSQR